MVRMVMPSVTHQGQEPYTCMTSVHTCTGPTDLRTRRHPHGTQGTLSEGPMTEGSPGDTECTSVRWKDATNLSALPSLGQ